MKAQPWELTDKERWDIWSGFCNVPNGDLTKEYARTAQLKLVKWLCNKLATMPNPYEGKPNGEEVIEQETWRNSWRVYRVALEDVVIALDEVKASLAPDAREGER